MIATIYLVIVLISLLVLHIVMRYKKSAILFNTIPGPTALPFIRNALELNVSSDHMWQKILELLDDYYPIFRLWIFKTKLVFFRHPDDMKTLLSCKKNIDKGDTFYGAFRGMDNDGLGFSRGEKWQHRRKMVTPAFNPNLLKVYTEIVNEHTEQLIKNIKNENTEIIPDIVPLCLKHALHIICEAAMGVNLNDFDANEVEEASHVFREITGIAFYRATRPYLQDWMMKFLSVGRKQELAVKRGRDMTNKIIQKRREYNEKIGCRKFELANDDVYDGTSIGQRKRLAVLDLLLAAEKDKLIDQRGVREEVETFIVAGHETSGVAIAFALLLLAENKAAQELARDEVNAVLNETNGELKVSDLNKLEYLDRCVKEALRMYPSAPIIGRSITHDIKLSNYEIPHKTDTFMNLFALQRDPNFWPDPEKFDPDRFLPDQTKERHPFAYLPFSAGPRNCIGYKFAMLELKAVLARFLHNFYIEPVISTANVKFEMHTALKPKDPCPIKLIKIS